MGQKKLVRFAELLTFPNVLQNPEGMAGKVAVNSFTMIIRSHLNWLVEKENMQ